MADQSIARAGAEMIAAVERVADRADLLVDAARRCAEAIRRGSSLVIDSHPERRAHAEHVAVEFVHPVITGKRAVPALTASQSRAAAGDDLLLWLGPGACPAPPALTVDLAVVAGESSTNVSDVTMVLTHHLLWELTHAILDHEPPDDYLAGLERAASRDVDVTDVIVKVEQATATIRSTMDHHADLLGDIASALSGTTRRVWTFGQGGSAADAALAAQRLGGVCLSANAAVLTALVNDIGPDAMYLRQVSTHVRRDDLVIALTTSGTSPAVLRGLATATAIGARAVACTGAAGLADQHDAPTVTDVTDVIDVIDVIDVGSDSIHRIQETHLSAIGVIAAVAGRR